MISDEKKHFHMIQTTAVGLFGTTEMWLHVSHKKHLKSGQTEIR